MCFCSESWTFFVYFVLVSVSRLPSNTNTRVSLLAVHNTWATVVEHHVNCESAIYVMKGHGRFIIGENLDNELPIGPGDFIYVPQDGVHQPVNDSNEVMELIVARNTPVEIVEEYSAKQA